MQKVKIIECPRDAMQGWSEWIPTEKKIEYLNTLLQVGFHTLDCGSFVSHKAIPQLADTKLVIPKLIMTDTKLLVITANYRGAKEAVQFDEITYIGFPFSISETFQKLNTNSSIEQSFEIVEEIQKLCLQHKKELVIYISMGFGNPYQEPYNAEIAIAWVKKLVYVGIKIFALSDTVGVSNPSNIKPLFTQLTAAYPDAIFGAHFHSLKETAIEKIEAAIQNNCFRFDSAIGGIGGCPMSQNELVGNIDTIQLIDFLEKNNYKISLNKKVFEEAKKMASAIFRTH